MGLGAQWQEGHHILRWQQLPFHYRSRGEPKWEGIGGVAGGTALWLLVIADESGFDPIEAYPFCVGFVSMFTVPAGALGGLIKGAIKQGRAIEYVIGPTDWQIVQ